ncbi:hypothetical protein ACP275_07G087700 [Erythranthe tilingii]
MKRKYASLSATEKQEYINKVKQQRQSNTVPKPTSKLKNNKYKNLSPEEKRNYIQHVTESRKQRQARNYASVSSLLSAQMIPYESKGSVSYDPVYSELHELKSMPECIHCGAVRFEYEPPTFCVEMEKSNLHLLKFQMICTSYLPLK